MAENKKEKLDDDKTRYDILLEKSKRLEKELTKLQEANITEDMQRTSLSLDSSVFFKESGINFKKIINMRVEITAGHRTYSGILLAINENFKLFQIKLFDGRICVVKLAKISSIVYGNSKDYDETKKVFND